MSRVKYSGEQSKKKLILNDDQYLQIENQPFEEEANATSPAKIIPQIDIEAATRANNMLELEATDF